MPNVAGLLSLAQSPWTVPAGAIMAGLVAAIVLSGMRPAIRLGGAAFAALAAGGVLLLRLHAPAAETAVVLAPAAPKAPPPTFDQALFQTYPAYKTLAEREPMSWEEPHRDIAEVLEVHGPDDPGRKAGLAAVFQRLNTTLLHGAASATDTPLLAYLTAENTFTKALQKDALPQCADAALGTPDLASLPPDDVPLFHAAQAALVDAYLDGGKTPVQPPEKTREQALMRRAVDPGAHPFTPAELAQFVNRSQQTPAVVCGLTIKFYDNVAALPAVDGAALLRAVLRTR